MHPLAPSSKKEISTSHASQAFAKNRNRNDDYAEDIPSFRNFHQARKTQNLECIQEITETKPVEELSPYKSRKRETITAEVYIRNPSNLKPTIINVSTTEKESKRPYWMIVKAYESSSGADARTVSRKNPNERKIQIRSGSSLDAETEKLSSRNLAKSNLLFKITAPKTKDDISEKDGIPSDSKLRSTVHLKTKTETKTSIKSRIISETDNFRPLITMKSDEICEIHHTDNFERFHTNNGDLVEICRRGSPIFFIFQYNNNLEILDNLSIIFKNELTNHEFRISAVKYNYSTPTSATEWHATYKIQSLGTAIFEILTPADSPIGLWQMTVQCDEQYNLSTVYLCILFNPWNKDDETYYANQLELKEYILNELAIIHKWHQNDAWILGQFSAVCMKTVLELLKMCEKNNFLRVNEFGSACAVVKGIARAISKFMMEIKWNDFRGSNYENEILPSSWTGSKEIMITYQKVGGRIGYGQSWCYAVCRCIGIPCRMTTIYNFPPQIKDNTVITLDLIDDMLAERSKDTIWHYHIWNELWLQSKFLKNGGDWHVCDATPISNEDGYQISEKGLFPVKRIKDMNNDNDNDGDVDKTREPNEDEYFGKKLHGKLNANIICNYYYRDPVTREPIFAYSKKLEKKMSNNLITTILDKDINVTMNYKQQASLNSQVLDGNFKNACLTLIHQHGEVGDFETNLSSFKNVALSNHLSKNVLQIDIDKPINGYLIISNKSLFERTVNAQIQIDLTSYTGLVITHIYLYEKMLIIKSKQSEKMEFTVPADYIRNMFTEDWNISITAFTRILHTDERFYAQQIIALVKPVLSIRKKNSLISSAKEVEEQFQISMINSTNILLTGCEIRIDGAGLLFCDSPILCGFIEFQF
uniref:Transglutaminase-like domain-containing protein n=1 Tax=Setaria digitata TaxID=48799 RepID=A0A915Q631_9BILA